MAGLHLWLETPLVIWLVNKSTRTVENYYTRCKHRHHIFIRKIKKSFRFLPSLEGGKISEFECRNFLVWSFFFSGKKKFSKFDLLFSRFGRILFQLWGFDFRHIFLLKNCVRQIFLQKFFFKNFSSKFFFKNKVFKKFHDQYCSIRWHSN